MFVILKESELHHSIGSLIDEAHLGPKTNRDYLDRNCLYQSSDLGEPSLSGSLCCDKFRFLRNHKHAQQLSPSNNNHLRAE